MNTEQNDLQLQQQDLLNLQAQLNDLSVDARSK